MILDRNYIEQLAFDVNSDAFVFSFEKIKERLEIAISNIMEKNTFITGYCIEPANEALTGAETVNSTLDLYLEISAPFIEKHPCDKGFYFADLAQLVVQCTRNA